jgi:protein TonB
MKQIIITMLLLAATIANAQDKGKTPQDAEKGEQQNEIFDDYFEPTAHFPGGDKAYLDYIKKNMRYPEEAKKKGIEGRVLVQCVIEKDGSHNSYKVIKSADSLLNEEAIRIVKGMPKWIPGNDWGETKRVRYTMPITFKLEVEGPKRIRVRN